jgi:hypothetical protein
MHRGAAKSQTPGEAKRRTALLLSRGLQTRSETELNLGRVLGEFDS